MKNQNYKFTIIENKDYKYKSNEGISFSDEELTLIKNHFNYLLYFPYERLNLNKSSLSYMLPCVPFFMRGDDWKFICSGFKIYIDKIEIDGIIEYCCDVYLSGVKYVDGKSDSFFINSSHFTKTDLGKLMDELLSIISENQVFEEEHRVEHISF